MPFQRLFRQPFISKPTFLMGRHCSKLARSPNRLCVERPYDAIYLNWLLHLDLLLESPTDYLMPAIPHDPKADIQLIRNLLLRAGYEDGLPVLKELLQNADDAGAGDPAASAKNFWVVLCPRGLPGATHPLLQDRAGLCVLNDGDFTESDATCLPMLGLSSKAAEQASVGKFGIGLKTVFFLAEVFFFFSHHEKDWPEAKACEFVNPWGPKHRQPWEVVWTDAARHEHRKLFRDWGTRILQQAGSPDPARFVGIWIPLRLQADKQPDVIHQHFPTPDYDAVFGARWAERVQELMPLLRHVRNLKAQVLHEDGRVEETLQIAPAMAGDAQFMRVGGGGLMGGFELRLAENGPTTLRFSGHEFRETEAFGRRFQNHQNNLWPRQAVFGDAADQRERATPHGAVVFTRRPALGKNGRLLVQHAVFLPLSDAEQRSLPGGWDYSLFLHGFYFVDSSRRHIERYSDLPVAAALDTVSSEEEMRKLWNRTLVHEVIAPLVLPSLEKFVGQEGLGAAATAELVRALANSVILMSLTKWICRKQRFIPLLQPAGSCWVRQTWHEDGSTPPPWIELPAPGFPEFELFNLLPALADLSGEVGVSLAATPRLAEQKPVRPDKIQVAKLLARIPVSTFDKADHLAYLLELVPEDAGEPQPDSPLTQALVGLANQVISRRLPADEIVAELWRGLFLRLPTEAIVRLPVKSAEVCPEIAATFGAASLPVALLWQECRDATGNGTIPWAALLPILKQLSALALDQEAAVKQRSAVAVRLLKAAVEQTEGWKAQMEALLVFASREPGGMIRATSLGQLQVAAREGRLFTGVETCAQDLVKAAPELKPLFVVSEVAEVLKLTAPNCDPIGCVRLLKTVSRLATDFVRRKPLIERFLQEAHSNELEAWAMIRCLLHGEVAAWLETATLFDETGASPALLKLLGNALEVARQPWRCIAPSIVGQIRLTTERRLKLNLIPAKEETVEALLREIGPGSVDCSGLSTEDCDFLLERFQNVEVLRGLNIHETLDGTRVRISTHTYVDDGTFQDLPAMCRVTRLRNRPGYARFRQTDGFRPLNWEAVIEIELDQPNPEQKWDVILTAIGHLGTLRAELRERVRAVAWLPLADPSAVKPSQLLDLPGAEAELDRLPPEVLTNYLPLLRLTNPVQLHKRFDTFRHAVLSPPRETVDTLANLLCAHPVWSTGVSGECTADQIADWVKALMDAPETALPVARLVKVLLGQASVSDLVPVFFQRISGRLSEEAYAGVLKHLAESLATADAETRHRILNIEFRYLSAIAGAGCTFATTVLTTDGVKLISSSGGVKDPHHLAFADPSLHPEDQLDARLSDALMALGPTRPLCPEPVGEVAVVAEQGAAAVVAALREYFNPWRALITPCEPVGALLSLFGMGGKSLSSEFFSTWSPEEVLDWLEKADQAVPSLGSIRNRLARRDFRITIVTEPHALVGSLLGNEFTARLADQPTSLLVPDEGYAVNVVHEAGRVVCRMRLRKLPLDRGTYTEEVLVNLLRETAALVLAKALRANVDVRPLFQKLSEATQLHVAVAQNMIVDQALAFLRQIGAQSHPRLKEALGMWDDARRQEAVEDAHAMTSGRSTELRRKARDNIRRLLAGETQVQAVVLVGVKRKLSEFQYTACSVPFEIWQNADDAVSELVRLGLDPNQAAALGFVTLCANDALLFGHWGRLINEFAGPDGSNCRGVGFDRDLEKMLVPAISDKSQITAQGQAALTGKFGLGFKSVFFITDTPEILSGNVDFVIRGGIYPVRLDDLQRATMEHALRDMSPGDWRRGTLIRLPLRSDGSATADQVLALFRALAPILVVFARRLKRLRFRSPNQKDIEIWWHPQALAEGIGFGEMPGLDGPLRNALVLARDLGCDRVQFLLGLGTHGFVPLPDHIPVFWVTAPTRCTPGYGFAVNGPFEPDVGRVQLALESDKNRQLAGDLAGVVSSRLAALWQEAATNWDKLRDVSGLATATTAQALWESLWQVLGCRLADKCRKEGGTPEATLALRILWSSEADGLQSFYCTCAALPTGLWGDYRTLTSLPEVHYAAVGALDREPTFQVVSRWPLFREKVAVGHICSTSFVVSVLERLSVQMKTVEPVYLANAVEWELGQTRRSDSELAGRLGLLITLDFLKALGDGKPSERDDREHKALNELLPKTQFQAADGSWHEPRQLVIPAAEGAEPDEKLRATFAPRECRLNSAYSGSALAFFLACRPRLEADVETMAEWVLLAAGEEARAAALRYLLRGGLKERLAEKLRSQRDDSKWLWQLHSSEWFRREFPDENERHEILSHCLRLFEEQFRLWAEAQQHCEAMETETEVPRPRWTVRQLWLWWERQGMPTGDYTLEGEANKDLFHCGMRMGEEDRKAELKRLLRSPEDPHGKTLWYRLFAYACLVSAGRTVTELREFWRDQLNARQFWERTSEGDFSEATKEIFKEAVTARFTNMSAGGEQAYFWRRLFYDVRKVHRMIRNEFPSVFLDLVNQGHGKHLFQFLRTGDLPGPDQRRWIGTFGQSADTPLRFIVRELVRLEVIPNEEVRPFAFYFCRPVRRALWKIGWIPNSESFFSGEDWLAELAKDGEYGRKLLPYYDIPFLHMGITYRGESMPVPPLEQLEAWKQ